jgi:hypothetical protein
MICKLIGFLFSVFFLVVIFVVGGFAVKSFVFYRDSYDPQEGNISFAYNAYKHDVFAADSLFFLYGSLTVLLALGAYGMLLAATYGLKRCCTFVVCCRFCVLSEKKKKDRKKKKKKKYKKMVEMERLGGGTSTKYEAPPPGDKDSIV